MACLPDPVSEAQRWLEMNKPLLFMASVFGVLAIDASAQTPPPKGWLPPEQLREELPAKFFGTWCKVKEDAESEQYQRPPRGERCGGGAEIFIGVRMLIGAGDPRRCQIVNATGNMNDWYFTVLNCNGGWVRYLLRSNEPGVLHILPQTDPEAARLWSDDQG
jgi:hypothetical protein